MADLKIFSSIQDLIEAWWKEQRPEGNNSPAPLDLPIYQELLNFTHKQLKESKIAEKQLESGEKSYVAISPSGEAFFHDGPPDYEAHSTDQKHELGKKDFDPGDALEREMRSVKTHFPVDTPFSCGGVYDYIGRNGSKTYGVFSSRPYRVTYNLKMTSTGVVSGTSKDSCGPATIEGTVDCETGAVEFIKRYSWCNLWAQWNYHGKVQDVDGNVVILGRWESGRFAIWLDTKGLEHDQMAAKMMHLLDSRDLQRKLDDGSP